MTTPSDNSGQMSFSRDGKQMTIQLLLSPNQYRKDIL